MTKKRPLTNFQAKVLRAVSQIPLGQTRSYVWVARKIGRPKSARAVGQALNKNPYLLLIPCHRVVHQDGSLGGFALGVKTKKALLELEERIAKQFSGK